MVETETDCCSNANILDFFQWASPQKFESWKFCLMKSLQQYNPNFGLFLPGGLYSTWSPALQTEDGRRIFQVVPDDPGLRVKPEGEENLHESEEYLAEQRILSCQRDKELDDFIFKICQFINLTEEHLTNTIQDCCTSFEAIIELLQDFNSIKKKETKIYQLSELKYNPNEDFELFYKSMRHVVCNNLKKKGEIISFLDNEELLSDEKFSPTFEEVILLWCLEKIDPNLPELVNNKFGSRLSDNVSIKDIEKEVFNFIPVILQNGACQKESRDESLEFSVGNIKCSADDMAEFDKSDIVNMDQMNGVKEEGEAFDSPADNSADHSANHVTDRVADPLSDHEVVEDNASQDVETNLTKNEMKAEKEETSKILKTTENKKSRTLRKLKQSQETKDELQCYLCDRVFVRSKSLQQHLSRMHEITTEKKDEEKKNFTCHTCSTEFSDQQKLKIHQKEHDGFRCDECGRQHSNYRVLYQHIAYNHRGKGKCKECRGDPDLQGKKLCPHSVFVKGYEKRKQKYACPECGKEVRKDRMEDHIKCYHRPKQNQLPCEICGKFYSNQQNLQSHLRLHKLNRIERKFSCATCKRSFFNEEDKSKHACKHYSCDECDAKFVWQRNLKRHKLMHAGHVIYPCPSCESLFENKRALNSHKNITHSDRRKFACDKCPKTFKTVGNLKCHKKLHTGEKPFDCNQCDKSFSTKAHLQAHSMTHSNDSQFGCKGCGHKFRTLSALKKHREAKMCGLSETDLYQRKGSEDDAPLVIGQP